MDLEFKGSTFAVTTGGYESAIPSESVYQLEDAKYFTRVRAGSSSTHDIELANIFSDSFCVQEPMFTVQFGRSDAVNTYPTYQAIGSGVKSLAQADHNIRELSHAIESTLGASAEYSTHRPFVRAHSTLQDSSVLYTELYYHSFQADSVKHFEMVLFHPHQPFDTGRYEGIFQQSPVGTPNYTEETNVKRKTDFEFVGYEPERIQRTEAFRHSTAIDMGYIENPLTVHGISFEPPWNGFNTPEKFITELYCQDDEFNDAKITSTIAVEFDIIEPIFYKIEIDI